MSYVHRELQGPSSDDTRLALQLGLSTSFVLVLVDWLDTWRGSARICAEIDRGITTLRVLEENEKHGTENRTLNKANKGLGVGASCVIRLRVQQRLEDTSG
jgi:hypothetical protein